MAKHTSKGFALAQRLGRSLMLPIATLPAAGLLLRLGQSDVLGEHGLAKWGGVPVQFIADMFYAAGSAVFSNLAFLFAVGVAVGFARRSDGSTGVAAVFGFFVYTKVTETMSSYVFPVVDGKPSVMVDFGVLGGIIIGILTARLWQKYYRIRLPEWLAFFGGRRFVPIVASLSSMIVGIIMSLIFPGFNWLINKELGGWLMSAGQPGASPANRAIVGFVYGTLNRLLNPFGLHHLLNSIPWFNLGQCLSPEGKVVRGDINCFFLGTPETSAWTGNFTSGFFPIFMFAMPAAAIAIAHVAYDRNKKTTMSLMISIAITVAVTGVTEPLEFAFAYIAPPLFVVHAFLTGSALAVTNALGSKDSFTFSAGVIDFVLNLGKSARYSGGWFNGPIMLIILGIVYAIIYYPLFRFMIVKFDYKTPGREDDEGANAFAEAQEVAAEKTGKKAEEAAHTPTATE